MCSYCLSCLRNVSHDLLTCVASVACRLQNTLRMVKLTSMQDEYAYLLTEDIIALISRIIAEQEVWSVAIAPCYFINMQEQLWLQFLT